MKHSVLVLLCILGLSGCMLWQNKHLRYLEAADHFTRTEEYEKAIEAYHKHIQYRLALEQRPEWENPYFYLLIIGDLYLGMEQPENAIKAYAEAEKHDVSENLVRDRYRFAAAWHENHGNLEEAFKILNTHRGSEGVLFDLMLDRIGRRIVEIEELERSQGLRSSPAPSPSPAE